MEHYRLPATAGYPLCEKYAYVIFFFALWKNLIFERAKVAELADAPDLGSGTERCGGSSPPFRTIESKQQSAVSSQQTAGEQIERAQGITCVSSPIIGFC